MLGVDIHTIDLDDPQPHAADVLSPDEFARARRFRFDRDCNRYINCRSALRRILAGYVLQNAADLQFTYNEYGKPSLAGIRFNVSHSDRLALIAVSEAREVGIDIERIDASFAKDQIPEHFFSPYEIRSLRALPELQQLDAFFNCWTRKEAYIKARGLGMALPLQSFDVTLEPGRPAEFLRGAGDWSIEAVAAPTGYAAAVCGAGVS